MQRFMGGGGRGLGLGARAGGLARWAGVAGLGLGPPHQLGFATASWFEFGFWDWNLVALKLTV